MNCVFACAKMYKMVSVYNVVKTCKKILENGKKILEKSGIESQGILSVRKSGNPGCSNAYETWNRMLVHYKERALADLWFIFDQKFDRGRDFT